MVIMSDFEKAYQQLNPQQKNAVDSIDGPLLVLAGPGTGKTQLLSARVANILTKTDTNPSNIVCLTFTINAANNMRERLRNMIGPDANHVIIKTFHSLAADIIAKHPERFYAGAVLNPVTDLAAQEILHGILEKLDHDNPLAAMYDDRYVHMGNALQAIGRAKDAGLSPTKLREAIDNHQKEITSIEPAVVELFSQTLSHKTLPELAKDMDSFATESPFALAIAINRLTQHAIISDTPTNKTTLTGKLKAKLLANENGHKVMVRERRANTWWSALVDVYQQYQQTLYKRGYMDYSDMLVSVLEALEQDMDLRLDVQEATHYLLVDEFQDSNEAQIKLMHLLVDNPHIGKPNIMVVGDPNQTIYGFNGAMLDNTTDFQRHYASGLTTIELLDNYRSSQSILDESLDVIRNYSDFSPQLVARNEPTATSVDYILFETEAEQAASVAIQAHDILRKDPSASVAVLARGHSSLSYIANRLGAEKLSVNYEQSIDLRTTACNQLITNTLSLIQSLTKGDRPGSNHQLSTLLRHPTLGVPPESCWSIAMAATRHGSWADMATKYPATSSIMGWLNHLVSVAASQPLPVLLEQVLSAEFAPGQTLYTRFYSYDDQDPESMAVEAQATRQLLELSKQFAQTERVSLDKFLDMLTQGDDKLFLFSPALGHFEHAVTLMTVHGAKGLEFDHVFVIDASESNWKPRASRYPTPLSLPVHVNLENSSDYARLMYVAMTRARQSLYVSYVSRIDAKTKALPAEQLATKPFVNAPAMSLQDVVTSETSQLVPPRSHTKTMRELLADTLTNYELSATALTHFLDLSRQGMDSFIDEQLLRLPQPVSEVLAHGNAMHAALELAQIQTTNDAFDLDAIKRLYEHKIEDESLSTTTIRRLTNRANNQLDRLFLELGLSLRTESEPEQSFRASTRSGLNMYGKIDRIDIIDQRTIRIVDYKTGKPITNPNSKAQDVMLKQWRHKLQLGFYILLLQQQKAFADKRITAQIIQLDATEPEHLVLNYEIDHSELNHIEQLAHAVYKRIRSLDIPDVAPYEPTLAGIRDFETWLLKTAKNE